ncbi:MAG: hypothetical protein ABL964_09925 [Steroidobacteraceae bacterium]
MTAILSSLFLQAGLAYMPAFADHGSWGLSPYDRQHVYNPYGTFAIGLETDTDKAFSVAFSVRHESSIPVNDWGDNTIEFSVKWKPFRK